METEGGQLRHFHGSAGFGLPVRVTGVLSLGDYGDFFLIKGLIMPPWLA